jgi:dTDP-4-dehydrorhamnose reductase
MRIAVIGARGQLGAAIVHELAPHHEVTALDRASLDITDADAVSRTIARVRPDAIVNCAAYNAVDGAEDHPVDALRVNAIAVRSLARAANVVGASLVHYSTDFVFDGTATRPYSEADRPNPKSAYATSKLLGEWFASDVPQHYVLRVESLFGRVPGGPSKGSVDTIVATLRVGTAARVFEDRTASPTFVVDAARATRALIEQRAASGLYHCVNSGHGTWVEIALEIARLLGVEPTLEVVKLADVPMRAARPPYCALSNEKLRAAGIDMPRWEDALGRSLAQGSGLRA